jgi:hypothetical protein
VIERKRKAKLKKMPVKKKLKKNASQKKTEKKCQMLQKPK